MTTPPVPSVPRPPGDDDPARDAAAGGSASSSAPGAAPATDPHRAGADSSRPAPDADEPVPPVAPAGQSPYGVPPGTAAPAAAPVPSPQPYAAPYANHPPAGNPYAPQPYGVVGTAPSRGMSIAALILGAGGMVFSWVLLGIPSILAIVFGHIGLRKEPAGRGLAIAGLVLGYVAVGIFVLWLVFFVLSAVLGFAGGF